MDEDDFDEFDDIPEEDLLLALTQATDQQHQNQTWNGQGRSSGPSHSHSHGSSVARTPGRSAFPLSSRSTHNPVGGSLELDMDVDDIPSDAFNSSPENNNDDLGQSWGQRPPANPSQNMRQTTLWGNTLNQNRPSMPRSQSFTSRPFVADLPPEIPTHHELNHEELGTWVYPLNLGAIRDYQYTIVKNGLFKNTLVALPTGLGKTFIAATVILNYLRWTKDAQVVFVAPTKPLAEQQVQACLSVAGIPRSQATLLTGETNASIREGEWEKRRLFFMTPQTLMNDLSKGIANPKKIVLLVIDEAHRATGNYAYVKVIEFIRRFSKSFRVLALTATPGSSVEAVQDVINNLEIAHVEIRTEESLDIRKYVHSRNTEIVTFDPSDEMNEISSLFTKALTPLVDKLAAQNIYTPRDPMSLTTFGLMKTKSEWMQGPGRHANDGLKFSMFAVFATLMGLAHSIKLFKFHGIKPLYHNLAEFRNSEEAKTKGGSKMKRQVLDNPDFQKMMRMLEAWMKLDDFIGHPKLTHLCQVLVNHYMDAGENSATRSIVFSEYRDSAEEIVRLLNKQPLIKATVFVGQADSKRSDGMTQGQQRETIEKFKNGVFNVLVATSIGEEGLDIGQVDLIVCYDASSSPIRMLQRMGRTGRKRAGNVVLLLMKGKEEDKFQEAKLNYQKMQEMICDGSHFAYRHDLSTRILPRTMRPEVDKRMVEIPVENTQDPSLPEPKKTKAKKKAAPKRFNMPDGVITGFITASMIGKPGAEAASAKKSTTAKKTTPAKKATPVRKTTKAAKPAQSDDLVPLPEVSKVLLSQSQTLDLNRQYRELPPGLSGQGPLMISAPSMKAFPDAQRTLRPFVNVPHGEYTKRCVELFDTLGKSQDVSTSDIKPYGDTDFSGWESLPCVPFADDDDLGSKATTPASRAPAKKRSRAVEEDDDDDVVEVVPKPKKSRVIRDDDDEADPKPKKSRATKQDNPDPKPKKPRATAASKGGKAKNTTSKPSAAVATKTVAAKTAVNTKTGKIANRNSRIANFSISSDENDHNDEPEDEEEEEPTTIAPAASRARARGRQPKGRRAGGGSTNEDYGDSCLRTSDMDETDGSDDGADLVGFVLDDNEITSSMQREMMTSPLTAARRERKRQRKLATVREDVEEDEGEYYVPVELTVSSDDDDDDGLPDIGGLATSRRRAGAEGAKGRRRRIVINSDDEME